MTRATTYGIGGEQRVHRAAAAGDEQVAAAEESTIRLMPGLL